MANKAFGNLLAAVDKLKGGKYVDPLEGCFWKVEGDKAGNGMATIRFLPAKSDDDIPFVKHYNHGWKNEAGRWFIEDCPTTIGNDCPVCASNGILWNTGLKSDKEIVRNRKRKLSYTANIMVVEDRTNPDCEGNIYLFKFGQKIFDKIVDRLQPQFADEDAINVFDGLEGANFKLKMRRLDGFANFDKSEFEAPSPIPNLGKVMTQLHDIQQFVDPKKFKSFADIETKLNKFLGVSEGQGRANSHDDEDEGDSDAAYLKAAAAAKSKAGSDKPKPAPKKEDDSDADLAFFKSLAEDDDDIPF